MRLPGDSVYPYVLTRRLGSGGAAEVWQAQHELLGIRVALKILKEGKPASLARLQREGRAQAALDHPNLLPVRDLIEVDSTFALVLPLIEGPSLAALFAAYAPSFHESVGLFRGITAGVAHAHARGLVHRDLKPGNVLLDASSGRVVPRVSDFGLVKSLGVDGLTREGSVLGTLSHAAPEQLLDPGSADARADVFSLGVLLLELITGVSPFAAATLGELLAAHRRPLDLAALPAGYRELVSELLSLNPAERLADGAAVLARLDQIGPPDASDAALALGQPLDRAVRSWWSALSLPSQPRSPGLAEGLAVDTPGYVPTMPLASTAPAPAPLHNLRPARDVAVNRDEDLVAIDAALDAGARLVTIVGPGGAGKTRLAEQYGRSRFERWPGGVWFCDLADAREAAHVAYAVARALDIRMEQADPVGRLGLAIRGRGPCILILDNFEQVADHAASTVGMWLDHAPEARFLVTSREILQVAGEVVCPISTWSLEQAVALYKLRAGSGSTTLASSDRASVEALVDLLDRLPLAIELAAARARVLGPEQLLARMGERFRWLSLPRGPLARHLTLRATLDWSWELLKPSEQEALLQLATFEGGFTVDAAERVLQPGGAGWPLDAVQSLVDKSLVRRARRDRFDLLVSVQAYAQEKLGESSDPDQVYRRHAAYFAAWGQPTALAALTGEGGVEQRTLYRADLANLLVAHRWAVRAGDGPSAAGAALAAWAVIEQTGPMSLGVETLEAALPIAGRDRGRVAQAAGEALRLAGDRDTARTRLQEALVFHREARDRLGEAIALSTLGLISSPPQRALLVQALDLLRTIGNLRYEAVVLDNLAITDWSAGDMKGAKVLFERGLALSRQVRDRRQEGQILGNLGAVCVPLGEYAEARAYLRQALAIHVEVGNRGLEGVVLGDLGALYSQLGDLERARETLERALRQHQETGKRYFEGIIYCYLGHVLGDLGELAAGGQHLETAIRILVELGATRLVGVAHTFRAQLEMAAGEEAQALATLEIALPHLRAVGFALGTGDALATRGALRARVGDFSTARADLEEAKALLAGADPILAAQVWCRYAEVERLAGEPARSADALSQAEAVRVATGAGPRSRLGQLIAAEQRAGRRTDASGGGG